MVIVGCFISIEKWEGGYKKKEMQAERRGAQE
jgi:hypothetical protein